MDKSFIGENALQSRHIETAASPNQTIVALCNLTSKAGMMMPPADRQEQLRHRETLCLEVLLSGLDAHESAKTAGSPMLVYLAELLVRRTREELETIRIALESLDQTTSRDVPAP